MTLVPVPAQYRIQQLLLLADRRLADALEQLATLNGDSELVGSYYGQIRALSLFVDGLWQFLERFLPGLAAIR